MPAALIDTHPQGRTAVKKENIFSPGPSPAGKPCSTCLHDFFIGGKDMHMEWKEGFRISVNQHHQEVTVSANREGLLSLASQLRALAEGKPGDHIHYDAYNSLEEGSAELIIEKTE